MIVVSDTSPILNLARIGQLELLPALYRAVTVPPAVYRELTTILESNALLRNAGATGWLSVVEPSDQNRVADVAVHLDSGESEAIVLAQELGSDLLLMDERKGRRIANSVGLVTVGLLGVLVDAKRSGHVQQVKPPLDALTRDANFWVGAQLYRRVLDEVGE